MLSEVLADETVARVLPRVRSQEHWTAAPEVDEATCAEFNEKLRREQVDSKL